MSGMVPHTTEALSVPDVQIHWRDVLHWFTVSP